MNKKAVLVLAVLMVASSALAGSRTVWAGKTVPVTTVETGK